MAQSFEKSDWEAYQASEAAQNAVKSKPAFAKAKRADVFSCWTIEASRRGRQSL
jgi:hypothetical protein